MAQNNNLIHQFKISLIGTEPAIWRRIQVPIKFNFWDLHVAIQDSMGWLDCHLHEFRLRPKYKRKIIRIGIPDNEFGETSTIPGWDVPTAEFFIEPGVKLIYEYDFGDSWQHEIVLEGIILKEKGVKYPQCIGGEGACPPEDCGGLPGYYNLLEILANPNHPEYEDEMAWLQGHLKDYYPYDPNEFDPKAVHFCNSKKRWEKAFM